MKDSLVLAIETSCDETAVAIIRNETEVLSNVLYSQIKEHQQFGGVLPEVASRLHVEKITYILKQAIAEADIKPEDLTAIGVTYGPGLIGSLHVGLQAAKTLAWLYNKPLIGVHHIMGHIYANRLVDEIQYPALALVVSGGHSELVWLSKEHDFEILAQTGQITRRSRCDQIFIRALKIRRISEDRQTGSAPRFIGPGMCFRIKILANQSLGRASFLDFCNQRKAGRRLFFNSGDKASRRGMTQHLFVQDGGRHDGSAFAHMTAFRLANFD